MVFSRWSLFFLHASPSPRKYVTLIVPKYLVRLTIFGQVEQVTACYFLFLGLFISLILIGEISVKIAGITVACWLLLVDIWSTFAKEPHYCGVIRIGKDLETSLAESPPLSRVKGRCSSGLYPIGLLKPTRKEISQLTWATCSNTS